MSPAPRDNPNSSAETEGRKKADTPSIIVPGPWLMFGSVACGHALDKVWWIGIVKFIPMPYRVAIALVLGALGCWVVFQANVVFRRLGTAFEPWKPTSAIASADIYSRTRNPMYQGFFIMGPGIAVVLRSDWGILLLIPAALIVHYGVVLREERYLKRKFGESYLAYMAAVPRYGWPFPRFAQGRPKP
jgi:protein-S-isoprenylcysteine O-methyltransferase Ste14